MLRVTGISEAVPPKPLEALWKPPGHVCITTSLGPAITILRLDSPDVLRVDCGMVGSVGSKYRHQAGRIAIYCLEQSSPVNTFLRDLADPVNLVCIAGMHRSIYVEGWNLLKRVFANDTVRLQYRQLACSPLCKLQT